MQNEKEIRYIDLFGGVGGFRLGIERATDLSKTQRNKSRRNKTNSSSPKQIILAPKQFTCVWYCDINKYAVQTYNKNFGENWEAADIRTIKTSEIPDFDFLCAGFPCQAFSIAGKRRGFQDTRGTLFFEIARIIKAKRPKIIFLENVKGLLNHDKGQTFRVILQTISELGYDVQWMVLNSKFFGVPQNRERVFIVGSLRGESRSEILPFGESKEFFDKEKRGQQKKEEGISSTIDSRYGALRNAGETYMVHNALNPVQKDNLVMTQVHNMQPRSPNRPSLKYSSGGSGHLQREDTSYCIDGGNTNAVEFSNMKIRRLTPIECERLQGFPDNWTEGVSDTQRYKQMGNAVTVNVVQAIVEEMFK